MRKKLTIRLDSEIYDALHRQVGRGNISRFIEVLVRSRIYIGDLDEGYRQMAADEAYEAEAREWIEGLIGDLPDETR
jgi:hypothetical protein